MNSLYRSFVAPVILAGASLTVSPQGIVQTQQVSRASVAQVLVDTESQFPSWQTQQELQLVIEGQLHSLLKGEESLISKKELRRVVEDEIQDPVKRSEYLRHLDTIQRKKAGSGYSDVHSTDFTEPQIDSVQPNSSPRLMVDPGDDVDSSASNSAYRSVTPDETSNAPWYFPESNFEERPAKDGWVKSDLENSLKYRNERNSASESFAKEGDRLKEAVHHSEKMAAIYATIAAMMLLQIATLLLSERNFKKRLQNATQDIERQKAEHLRYARELGLEIENLREERRFLRHELQQKSTLCSSYSVHNKRLGEIQDRLRTKIEELEQRIAILQLRLESSPSNN